MVVKMDKTDNYKNLLAPIKVGTHTYRNRILAAPIYCGVFVNIPPLREMLFHEIGARARGGFAQVTIGETPVDYEFASREPFPPIDFSKYAGRSFEDLSALALMIRTGGAKALIELSHCGESMTKLPNNPDPIGPTAFVREEDGVRVKEMDRNDMEAVTEHFVRAAAFMKAAGFDGVLVHAGHGWLLHQFLSARTNRRTDEYGGSLENRTKFPLEVLEALRNAVGEDFILEMRVSGDEKMPGGMGVSETAAFCKMAEPYIDFIHVSVGVYRDPVLSGEFSSMYQAHGLNAEDAALIKKQVGIPVAAVGGIADPVLAEKLISEGKCDLVALARPATAEPYFAKKILEGNADDITKCIRCFKCFPGELEENLDKLDKLFGCTVNPEAFFYDKELLEKKPDPQNVLVIGGGVAGMQAAITAHDRGHRVILIEKSSALGGLVNFTNTDVYKTDLRNFKNLLIRRVERRNIEILLNTAFSLDMIREYKINAAVIAIGSVPSIPNIKGIRNALHALDVYSAPDFIRQRIIIIGGGLVGCETGINLAKQGKEVLIIEMRDEVALDSYPMHRIALLNEMDGLLVYKTGLKCTEIYSGSIEAEDKEGLAVKMSADQIIFALGMRGLTGEAEKLAEDIRGADERVSVYKIGDCNNARKVYEAVREGFTAGLSIH
jgi:2,4-dienoyl-CoA reductase-like NADH-dependent reductase (Old Yellow Enzyme family)/thioredoxin reductase